MQARAARAARTALDGTFPGAAKERRRASAAPLLS